MVALGSRLDVEKQGSASFGQSGGLGVYWVTSEGGGPCLRLVHPSWQQLIEISTLGLLELRSIPGLHSALQASTYPSHRAGGTPEAVTQDTARLQAARPSSPRAGMWVAHCSTPHEFLPRAGRIPSRHEHSHCLLPPGYVAQAAAPTIGCWECESVQSSSSSDAPPL